MMTPLLEQDFREFKALSNLAFEGLDGTIVFMSKGVLDPTRHSVMRFEDNSYLTKTGKLNDDILVARTRKDSGRDLSARTSRVTSTALRGRGSRFKTFRNLCSSLAESKEAHVEHNLTPNPSIIDNATSNAPAKIVNVDIVSRQ